MADIQGNQTGSRDKNTGKVWTIVAGLLVFFAILAAVYYYLIPRLDGEPLSSGAKLEMRMAVKASQPGFKEAKTPQGETVYVSPEIVLSAADISTFRGYYDENGQAVLALKFNNMGTAKIREYSRENLQTLAAFSVNDKIISCPMITAELGSRVVLELGELSRDDAEEVFARLTQ
ncbi:MAG: hypothetical protein JNL58_10790 [Planctomyces sp.]|nr:hypothetical protein [Planctomyces sp.]